jgi:hypothetical protein
MLRGYLLVLLLAFSRVCEAAQSPPTSGLVLWLDGADTTTMTLGAQDSVQRWNDKSGKSHHASVKTTTYGKRSQWPFSGAFQWRVGVSG